MDSNQSGPVGGIILGVFQGSLTHLGASRRLRGQKYIKARPILGHILTFLDPPLPTRSNFYGSKWRVQDIQMIRWIWNLFNINKTSRQVLGKIFKILKTKPYGALVIFWDKWVPGSWNRFWSSDHRKQNMAKLQFTGTDNWYFNQKLI